MVKACVLLLAMLAWWGEPESPPARKDKEATPAFPHVDGWVDDAKARDASIKRMEQRLGFPLDWRRVFGAQGGKDEADALPCDCGRLCRVVCEFSCREECCAGACKPGQQPTPRLCLTRVTLEFCHDKPCLPCQPCQDKK